MENSDNITKKNKQKFLASIWISCWRNDETITKPLKLNFKQTESCKNHKKSRLLCMVWQNDQKLTKHWQAKWLDNEFLMGGQQFYRKALCSKDFRKLSTKLANHIKKIENTFHKLQNAQNWCSKIFN